MMMSKKIAGAAATATLVVGAALGVASLAQADPTPSATSTTPAGGSTATTQPQQGEGHHGRHGRQGPGDGQRDKALADKLGVTQEQLRTAMQNIRKSHSDAKDQGTKPDREAMEKQLATDLAKELKLDESKVLAALQAVRSDEEATMAQNMKTRLDQAVKDGKLTQAEADAVLKAAKAGVIGYGPEGGRH